MAQPLTEPRELDEYDVDVHLATDRDRDCIVLDVGLNEHGLPVSSCRHIQREINSILQDKTRLASTKILYIVGEWMFSFNRENEVGNPLYKAQTITPEEYEWSPCRSLLCHLVEMLPNLTEFTWITVDFPFTVHIWHYLPTSLTKLVLDIGQPVMIHPARSDMRAMTRFTKLKELRLFNMHHSLQPIIWETVYRTTTEDKVMKLLDLKMAMKPSIRPERWVDVGCINGAHAYDNIKPHVNHRYKGMDGSGILHHLYGYGEYLDRLAMRRGRKASGPDKTRALPLLYLKLDNFVIDHLPFTGESNDAVPELGRIVFLSFGSGCSDAGFRPPRTDSPSNAWNHMVKKASTNCLIRWPKWAGIFDADGCPLAGDGIFLRPNKENVPNPKRAGNGTGEAMKATDPKMNDVSCASSFGDFEDCRPGAASSAVPRALVKDEDDDDWDHINYDEV